MLSGPVLCLALRELMVNNMSVVSGGGGGSKLIGSLTSD